MHTICKPGLNTEQFIMGAFYKGSKKKKNNLQLPIIFRKFFRAHL